MTYYDILWLILTSYSQRILKPYMVSHDQPVACFLEQNPHPARGDMASYLTSWKSVGSLRKMPSWVLQNGNSSRGILQSMPWMPWIQEIGGWWRWIGGGNWDLANPNGMRFETHETSQFSSASLLVFARVPGSLPNTATSKHHVRVLWITAWFDFIVGLHIIPMNCWLAKTEVWIEKWV